jgi:hypothetical protein
MFDAKIKDDDLASLTFWTETNANALETQIQLLKNQLDSFEVCSGFSILFLKARNLLP